MFINWYKWTLNSQFLIDKIQEHHQHRYEGDDPKLAVPPIFFERIGKAFLEGSFIFIMLNFWDINYNYFWGEVFEYILIFIVLHILIVQYSKLLNIFCFSFWNIIIILLFIFFSVLKFMKPYKVGNLMLQSKRKEYDYFIKGRDFYEDLLKEWMLKKFRSWN